ncbi:MAG TPA: LemA family protein, partial [Polyangiaceae bacterium]
MSALSNLLSRFRALFVLTVVALSVSGCGYNDVITHDETVKAAWAEVQNQYQRRADLVPNLVKTVKGAANFEKETLQAVVEARAKVGQVKVDASTIDDAEKFKAFQGAQGELS